MKITKHRLMELIVETQKKKIKRFGDQTGGLGSFALSDKESRANFYRELSSGKKAKKIFSSYADAGVQDWFKNNVLLLHWNKTTNPEWVNFYLKNPGQKFRKEVSANGYLLEDIAPGMISLSGYHFMFGFVISGHVTFAHEDDIRSFYSEDFYSKVPGVDAADEMESHHESVKKSLASIKQGIFADDGELNHQDVVDGAHDSIILGRPYDYDKFNSTKMGASWDGVEDCEFIVANWSVEAIVFDCDAFITVLRKERSNPNYRVPTIEGARNLITMAQTLGYTLFDRTMNIIKDPMGDLEKAYAAFSEESVSSDSPIVPGMGDDFDF